MDPGTSYPFYFESLFSGKEEGAYVCIGDEISMISLLSTGSASAKLAIRTLGAALHRRLSPIREMLVGCFIGSAFLREPTNVSGLSVVCSAFPGGLDLGMTSTTR
jgi:hypothetical protein